MVEPGARGVKAQFAARIADRRLVVGCSRGFDNGSLVFAKLYNTLSGS
jgi:hypothetical protein